MKVGPSVYFFDSSQELLHFTMLVSLSVFNQQVKIFNRSLDTFIGEKKDKNQLSNPQPRTQPQIKGGAKSVPEWIFCDSDTVHL